MSSAIAPLVGRFRRRVIRDVVGSVSLGTVLAIGFWNFVHIPEFKEYDNYFQKVQAEIKGKEDAWRASLNAQPAPPASTAASADNASHEAVEQVNDEE